jgi:hypothetical protein
MELLDKSSDPDKFAHPENAAEPNTVRLMGENVRTPDPSHPLNAEEPMLVIEEEKKAVNLLH